DREAAALRLAGRVVQVPVTGAEGEHAGAEVEDGVGGTVPPADVHRVRIPRAGVGDGAGHGGGVVLVDGGRAGRQPHAGGRHVADNHNGAARAAVAVLVGHHGGDREAAAVRLAGGVVEVPVAGAERQHVGGQVQDGVGRAVAPGDIHRVRIPRAGV